jgi:hypothetical protein
MSYKSTTKSCLVCGLLFRPNLHFRVYCSEPCQRRGKRVPTARETALLQATFESLGGDCELLHAGLRNQLFDEELARVRAARFSIPKPEAALAAPQRSQE